MTNVTLNHEQDFVTRTLLSQENSSVGWEVVEESKLGQNHYKFEEIDMAYWQNLLERNWSVSIYASVAYLVTIYGLQRWMKNRPAYSLTTSLFVWNLAVGVFSIMGFYRTAPGFLKVITQPGGFYQSLCERKGGDLQLPFWALAFVLSKYLELIDTVFLALRKKPVIFLQWYHHMITVVTCWSMYPYIEPVSRWFVVLNFGVHSFMYPYFALRAVGIKTPVFVPNFITSIQFAQMVIGNSVNVISIYYYATGQNCARDPFTVKLCTTVALSFLVLFGQLFFESVVAKGRIQKERLRKKVE